MTKGEARGIYRDAWTEYAFAQDEMRRHQLEEIMDGVQDACVEPWGEEGAFGVAAMEWKAFAATLPGYAQFFDMADEECEMLQRKLAEKLGHHIGD